MKLLILGLSSIVARRVLPAAALMDAFSSVDIASLSRTPPDDWPKKGRFYASYDEALAESGAEILYISLPNSLHLDWINRALEAGRHVIVDKPATLTLEEAEACARSAEARGLIFAEATVFAYHRQFEAMRALIADIGPLTHVDASFIIPPMPIENFRNYRRLGGGCLADMGPYAAATARIFATSELVSLAAVGAPAAADRDIDMGFSLLASFADGMRYTGNFSFESEYRNRLTLTGIGGSLVVDRCFSLPAEAPSEWQVRRANVASDDRIAPDDSFARFLSTVTGAIRSGDGSALRNDLLYDARFRARLQDIVFAGYEFS